MTQHRESRIVATSAEAIFDLVADVERYPEFLTLWRSARVYAREDSGYFTEQDIGLGPVRERFRTHTVLCRPHHINITSIDPLFKTFHIRWEFATEADRTGVERPRIEHARVTVALTWEVRSLLLQRAIETLLPVTASRMVSAFEARARLTRGRNPTPLSSRT